MQVTIKFLPSQKLNAIRAIDKAFQELPEDFEEGRTIIDEQMNRIIFGFSDSLYKNCGYCEIFKDELIKYNAIKGVEILSITR
jgi:hypothetical protein